MTIPKRNRGKSEKRPYSHSSNGHRAGLSTATAEEIAALYVRAGWLGPRQPASIFGFPIRVVAGMGDRIALVRRGP